MLDIPDVLQGQLSIPLRAECAVPRISADANPLAFGDCFVRHPYKRTLTLVNQSKLPAKFEVQQQVRAPLAPPWREPLRGRTPGPSGFVALLRADWFGVRRTCTARTWRTGWPSP